MELVAQIIQSVCGRLRLATVKAVTVYKLENEDEEPRCLGRIPYCGDDHLSGFRAFLEGNKENPIFPWPFDFWDSQARTRIAAELEHCYTLELHHHAVYIIRSHGQQSIAGKDILEPGTTSAQSSPHAAAEEPEQKDTSPFIASSSTTGPVACAPNSSLRENDSHEEPSCPTLQPRHKVFLSHSGKQKPFVAKLCKYLEAHNVYPFFDQRSDSLPKGEKFSTLILDAARKCRVAVVVLSEEYLSSKWPMLELAEFVRARGSENKNLNFLPLFYKASVGDLSEESIKNKWRPRWMKLVGSDDARVNFEDWARALRVLRGINGLSFDKFGNSKESYRDAVVKEIFRLAPPDLLYDTSKIFGWSRICEILGGMFLPHTKTSARVLGLYGMGGLGKSTMSTSLCNYCNQEFLGRVCYVEINEGSTPRERQQMVMRKLLRLDDLLLQRVSEVSQGWELLRTRMKEHPVLLVIDNVQPDEQSKEEAREYLSVKYSSGSKIMVTSRSSEVVEDLLGDPRYCHEIPCLTREEAARVLLQQGAPQMNHSSLTSDESRVVESCLEEAWFSQGSQSSEQTNIICDHEASISKAGHYHPLALRALGAYFHDRSKTSDLLSWDTYLHEYAQVKGTRESYRRIFNILGLQFNTLDRMTQLMFLDITLYGSIALETPMLSNSQVEEFVAWLSDIHAVATQVVRLKILDFKRFAMINIDGERIIVHDLYKEYATWFLEQVNFKEVTCVWCVSKHGCVELERTPRGGCWPELRRIRLKNIWCDGFSTRKVQEWCNIVVLQIDGCNKLTTLDLQGLSCLRHLELKRLWSLKTLVLRQTFPSLQFVTIDSLDSIQCLPSFSPFTSLKFLKVVDCDGLLEPPSVEHCSSLKRLVLSWYPQEYLPNWNLDGLTSLRDLTIRCSSSYEPDNFSYERDRALRLVGLGSLTSLRALELKSIPVEDLWGLASLTCVEYIHLVDMRYLTTLASLFNLAKSSLIVLEVWGLNRFKYYWPGIEEELDELQSVRKHKLRGLVAGVEVHVPDTPCKISEWYRRDVLEHPVVNAIQNVRAPSFSNAMFGRVTAAVPYMGVRCDLEQYRTNYVAEIRPTIRSKKVRLGAYETAEEAAHAFDIANLRLERKLPLNFPDSPQVLKEISMQLKNIAQLSPGESRTAIAKLVREVQGVYKTKSSSSGNIANPEPLNFLDSPEVQKEIFLQLFNYFAQLCPGKSRTFIAELVRVVQSVDKTESSSSDNIANSEPLNFLDSPEVQKEISLQLFNYFAQWWCPLKSRTFIAELVRVVQSVDKTESSSSDNIANSEPLNFLDSPEVQKQIFLQLFNYFAQLCHGKSRTFIAELVRVVQSVGDNIANPEPVNDVSSSEMNRVIYDYGHPMFEDQVYYYGE